MKEIKYGCNHSRLTGKENKFKEISSFKLPNEYSYEGFLPDVEDQGSSHMCVTYALGAHLDWNLNVGGKQDTKIDNHIDKKQIYRARKEAGDNGMTLKDGLEFLKEKGVMSDFGILKIRDYAIVGSEIALKQALLLNGPCVASIKIKNEEIIDDFWEGVKTYGTHAVAIVGYNNEGFIIRNSWGKSYGYNGYYVLPYNKFYNITEIWTIID